MTLSLGVSLHRRRATLVGVERNGKRVALVLERHLERNPGESLGPLLKRLLQGPAFPTRPNSLAIAISPFDLACADAWTAPPGMRSGASGRMAAALCETRCASETLETLVVDATVSGSVAQAVALDRVVGDTLLEAAAGLPLTLITCIPAVLSGAFGRLTLTQGGERIEVSDVEGASFWRAYPVDGVDDAGTLSWKGLELSFAQASAFAAAVCDADAVPNALRAFPQHRRTFVKRFRDPLINLAAAAALCLGALGVHFHREAERDRRELVAARLAEMSLWQRFLPSEQPREGRLLQAMSGRLTELGEGGAAEFPSALAFWAEIGRLMPDPEALGLTLESLDLAPDGGRIAARVPAVKDDPLKNATQLETKLNQSKKLSARGDYEVRDGQVQLRLRMDYKP